MSKSRFPESDIAAVLRAADIVAVAGEYTPLVRSGSSYKALCLFHDEKTPSMQVTPAPDGGHYYCYGCGQGGDVIDLVRQIDGLTFPEAVGTLADRFGVTLHVTDAEADTSVHSARTRIVEANELAARFFADNLLTMDEAAPARDLLTSRGFDVEQCVTDFGCGYAPRQPAALVRHLQQHRFSTEEIRAAELANLTGKGSLLGRFTGRLTWTIRNSFGKAIGFGARRLYDDDGMPGKFVNTSETLVYRKSEVLFGLDRARREIVKSGQAVVVEGYTDVMACHLAGVSNAVATCGTAFTSEHLSILRRLVGPSGEVIFGFDDDKAGHAASLKVYDLAQGSLHRLSALPSSENMDPDEVRQHRGDAALRALVDQRRPLIESAILTTISMHDLSTPENRRATLDEVLPLLEHLRDPLLRSEYVGFVAERLHFNPQMVAEQVKGALDAPLGEVRPADPTVRDGEPPGWMERDVLHALVRHRDLAQRHIRSVRGLLTRPAALQIAAAVTSALDDTTSTRPWPLLVLDQVDSEDPATRAALGPLVGADLSVAPDLVGGHLDEILARLRARRDADDERELRQAMEASDDEDERDRLFRNLLAMRAET